MTVIYHFHRVKGVITSGITFSVLLLNTTCSFVLLLDILLYNSSMYSKPETNNIYRICLCNCCLVVLSFFTDDPVDAGLKPSEIEAPDGEDRMPDNEVDLSPKQYCSFISKITFFWYTKLVKKANKRELKINEIYQLEENMKINFVINKFNRNFYKEIKRIEKSNENSGRNIKFNSNNLLKVVWKTYGTDLILIILLKTAADIMTFCTPLLMDLMMHFISSPDEPAWHGVLIIIGFILTSSLSNIFSNFSNMNSFEVAINLGTSYSNLVFYKALRLSPSAKRKTASGKIINLFSVDSYRFADYAPFFVYVWSTPFQITVGFYLLYRLLGKATFVAMFVISLFMILQYFLNRYRDKYLTTEMKLNDERMMLINEIFSGIKIIKLYAWEKAFIKKVTEKRYEQVYYIKLIYYLEMLANWIFFSLSPFIILTTTIGIYIFFVDDSQLKPEKAFVAISIFNILDQPIEEISSLIAYYFTCKVSTKRLSKFYKEDELEKYVNRKRDDKIALSIKNKARFVWEVKDENDDPNYNHAFETDEEDDTNSMNSINRSDSSFKEKKNFELKDIELEVSKGSFVAVIGSVGSGKSSLISAILGEMHLVENDEGVKGEVNISDDQTICYVAQQAWIQNDSFKNNVLFGKAFNEQNYKKVIDACALEPDLQQFEAYDETEIGEKGINLSGGQKQRVSLARACYSSLSASNSNQIILLDDPLSAVDAHVSKHLCDNVLNSRTGLLNKTTRILVTNQLNQLGDLNPDQIILLKDGKIELKCTYDELMEMEKNGKLDEYDLQLTQYDSKNESEDEDKEPEKSNNQVIVEDKRDENKLDNNKLIEKEKQEKGKVNSKNYFIYFKYFGFFKLGTALILMIGENCFQIFSRVYLAEWTNIKLNSTDVEVIKTSNRDHLLVFAGLALIECFLNIGNKFIVILGILSTVKLFHKILLDRILRAPMNFFDTTPLGRKKLLCL